MLSGILGTTAAGGGYAVNVGDSGTRQGFEDGDFGFLSNQTTPPFESDDAVIVQFLTNSGGPNLRLEVDDSGVPNDDTSFVDLIISSGPLAGTYARTDASYSTGGGQSSWTWVVVDLFIVDETYAFSFT